MIDIIEMCHIISYSLQGRACFICDHFYTFWEFPQCLQSCLSNWFYSKPWVLSIVKHEGSHLGEGVDSIVVYELSKGDLFIPIILTLVDKQSQTLLNLLVDTFCLTISLWVMCYRGCNLDPQEFVELVHELRDKLSAMVTDNLFWESMMPPYVVSKESCNSNWVYVRGGRDHMYSFGETIHHYQKCIIPVTSGQLTIRSTDITCHFQLRI